MIEIYNESDTEKKIVAKNYDFIIFNLYCTVLIKDSDFEIFFIDKRYHKTVILLTQKFASELDLIIFVKRYSTDEFEMTLFEKIFETLFPNLFKTSRSLQNFSEKLKMKEIIIEYPYQKE